MEGEGLAEQLATFQASAASNEEGLRRELEGVRGERSRLNEQLKASMQEVTEFKAQLELECYQKTILEGREKQLQSDLTTCQAKLQESSDESDQLRKSVAELEENMGKVENRSREMYEVNQRLEAHIQDLQARKRAPLYQKKQEEELKAANEKAQEAEVRVQEMESRLKEAKAEEESALRCAAKLKEEVAILEKKLEEAGVAAEEQLNLEVQKSKLERNKLQQVYEDKLETLQVQVGDLNNEKEQQTARMSDLELELQRQVEKVSTLQDELAGLQASLDESRACAAAAMEKVMTLEESIDTMVGEHQAQLAAAQDAFNDAQANAQKDLVKVVADAEAKLEEVRNECKAELDKIGAELTCVQAAAEQEVARLQSTILSMKTAASQSEAEAARNAKVQEEQLEVLRVQVAEQGAKLAEAAGALNAKEELREARMKHKQELAAVKGELQKLQVQSKSGEKTKGQLEKEMDNCKKKLVEVETKLRAALQEKQQALQDKVQFERQWKQLSSQQNMIEKNLQKKELMADKRRESIMVDLSKTKGQLTSVEDRAKQLSTDLQRTQMDLMAKSGECKMLEERVKELERSEGSLKTANDRLQQELSKAQCQLQEVTQQAQELQEQVQGLTTRKIELEQLEQQATTRLAELSRQVEELTSEHSRVSADLETLTSTHTELSQAKEICDMELAGLRTSLVELQVAKESLSCKVGQLGDALAQSEEARIKAEGQLPEIEVLQKQISTTNEELTDLSFQMMEERAAFAAKEGQLVLEKETLENEWKNLQEAFNRQEAEKKSLTKKLNAQEQQLNDMFQMCTSLQSQLQAMTNDKKELQAAAEDATKKMKDALAVVADKEKELTEAMDRLGALQIVSEQQMEEANLLKQELQQVREQMKAFEDQAAGQEEEMASLREVQQQLDQAYEEMSELQFTCDQKLAQAAAQVQQLQEDKLHMEKELQARISELSEVGKQLSCVSSHSNEYMATVRGQIEGVSQGTETLLSRVEQGLQQLAVVEDMAERGMQAHEQCLTELMTAGEPIHHFVEDSLEELSAMALELINKVQEATMTSAAREQELYLINVQCAELMDGLKVARDDLTAAPSPAHVRSLEEEVVSLHQQIEALQKEVEHAHSQLRMISEQHTEQSGEPDPHGQEVQTEALQPMMVDCNRAFGDGDLKSHVHRLRDGSGVAACQDAGTQCDQDLGDPDTQFLELQGLVAQVQLDRDYWMREYHNICSKGDPALMDKEITDTEQLHMEVVKHEGSERDLSSEHMTEALATSREPYEGTTEAETRTSKEDVEGIKLSNFICKKEEPEGAPHEDTGVGDIASHNHEMLQRQYDLLLDEHQRLQEEVRLMDAQRLELEGQRAELGTRLSELEAAAGLWPVTKEELESLVQSLQSRLSEASAFNLTLEQQVGHMGNTVLQLEHQLCEESGKNEVLAGQMTELLAGKNRVDDELSSAQALVISLGSEVSQLELCVNEMKQKLAERQREESTVQEQKSKLEAKVEELVQTLSSSEAKVTQLERERSSLEGTLQHMHQQLVEAEAKRASLMAQKEDLEVIARRLEDQLAEVSAKKTELSEEKRHMAVHLNRLQSDRKDDMYVEQIKVLLEEKQSLSSRVASQAGTISQLQEVLTQNEIRVVHLEEVRLELQKQLEAVTNQLSRVQQDLDKCPQVQDGHPTSLVPGFRGKDLSKESTATLELQQQLQRAMRELHNERTRHRENIQEVQEVSQCKEAELNAKVMQLESQLHWLTRQNQTLQQQTTLGTGSASSDQGGTGEQAGGEAVSRLEQELRKSKRAEQKLQALLYRLRKDLEDRGGDVAALDNLKDIRSLEYEVDFLKNRCQKYEKLCKQSEVEKQQLQQHCQHQQLRMRQLNRKGNRLMDKENAG